MNKGFLFRILFATLAVFLVPSLVLGTTGFEYLANYTAVYYTFDEPSGILEDIANGYDADEIAGTPDYNRPGIFNQSIYFSGSSEQFKLASVNATRLKGGTSDFSVCFWANWTEEDVVSSRWLGTDSYSGAGGYNGWYFTTESDWKLRFNIRNSTQSYSYSADMSGDLSRNVWHFVCGIKNGSNIHLLIDGAIEDTTAINPSISLNNSAKFKIGCIDTSCSPTHYEGEFDEFVFFDGYALNATEIDYLYAGGAPNISTRYPFGEESTGAANESTGRAAVLSGLNASEVYGSYVAYSDKQVVARLLNGTQCNGTFDEYIVSGDKRWLFNYDENSSSGFPVFYNLSSAVYVWQVYNLTAAEISESVASFVNGTYP